MLREMSVIPKLLVICVCSSCATAELVIAKSQDGTWETVNDCRVWVPHDTPAIEADWQGDCLNGLAHGIGTLTRTSQADADDEESYAYEGNWKNGKLDGKGLFTSSEGDRYEGQFKEGRKDGQGTYHWATGARYEGEWKAGEMHGQGKYLWSSGNYYEGEFKIR